MSLKNFFRLVNLGKKNKAIYNCPNCRNKKANLIWQPISTAPKDGTPILITVPYSIKDGRYSGGIPVVAIWTNNNGGFLAVPDLSSVYGYLTVAATHWMPVPDPPPLT